MKTPVHCRLDPAILAEVRTHAERESKTVSAAVESLVQDGLIAAQDRMRLSAAERTLAATRDDLVGAREQRAQLEGRAQVAAQAERLAGVARAQADGLRTQLELIVFSDAAVCGQASCGAVWTLHDVWQRRCPRCGAGIATVPAGGWPSSDVAETVRDDFAMTTGMTALQLLLATMSGPETP